jgi:O-antigen/teichoic acid export membrane protein
MAAHRTSTPSLTAQAFWLLVAKTVGFALTMALPLVLVRALSQSDFGLYKQAFLVVGTATTILPLGFGMSAFYFLPRAHDRHAAVVQHILAVHAAVGGLAAIALCVWPRLLAMIFGSDALVPYAPHIGAVIFTWTVGSFLDIVAVARQDLRASTFFIIGSQASKTAVFMLAALAAGSVGALITAAIVQGVAQIVVLAWYLQARFPGFWKSFHWPTLRTQASYALPLGLSALVLKCQNDVPHYFVAHAFGASAYAIFAVGVFNLPLIGLLRESVGSVMLPRVSLLEQQQDPRPILELVASVARKLALVYFPIYALLMVVGREVIVLLFTAQYLSSWPVFAIYLTIIPAGVIVLDPITRAYAEQRFFLLKVRIVLFAILIAVLTFATNRLGLVGTISLMVAVQLLGTIAAAARMSRVIRISRADLAPFAPLGGIAAAAAAAGVVAAATRLALLPASPQTVVIVCGAMYALAYGGAMTAARMLVPEEWALVRAMLDRSRMIPARRNVIC